MDGDIAVFAPSALPPTEHKPTRYFWTTREIGIIQREYPTRGLGSCLQAMPNRTAGAIYQKARLLGLLRDDRQPRRRQPWTTDEHIDAAIKRVYQSEPSNNDVNNLARQVMRPRWWVSKRAGEMGLVLPRFREPPWSPAEDEIVSELAHRKTPAIKSALKRSGFHRTETAIAVRRKRLGCTTDDPDHFTAHGLAGLMGVDPSTVSGWIEKGWLTAKRRGTARVAVQGGDMWWIHRKHVRRFAIEHTARVNIRKVDKFWFVDLLTAHA